jgi:hypothetical protein
LLFLKLLRPMTSTLDIRHATSTPAGLSNLSGHAAFVAFMRS